MAPFESIAELYDEVVVRGRFDHAVAVEHVAGFIASEPRAAADLAAGTGLMASALEKRFPRTMITCEEPCSEMLRRLRRLHPQFATSQRSLENTAITGQDLVTIAFNSINYLQPYALTSTLKSIRAGMVDGGLLYFDALSADAAAALLEGTRTLEKSRRYDRLTMHSRLTTTTLVHRFTLDDGRQEEHTQYLPTKSEFASALSRAGFALVQQRSEPGSLRTAFISNAVGPTRGRQ